MNVEMENPRIPNAVGGIPNHMPFGIRGCVQVVAVYRPRWRAKANRIRPIWFNGVASKTVAISAAFPAAIVTIRTGLVVRCHRYPIAGATVHGRELVSAVSLSSSVTRNVVDPLLGDVGVPDTSPLDALSDKPAGSDPACTLYA